jgi:hypothetical protein
MSDDQFDRTDPENHHPDKKGKWMWDNLSTYHSSPIDTDAPGRDKKSKYTEYEFFLHDLLLREETIQSVFVFSPVLVYLDSESEEYLLAEDILQDDARRCSDIVDLFATLSDDDRLL